jgi:hypothetical protein
MFRWDAVIKGSQRHFDLDDAELHARMAFRSLLGKSLLGCALLERGSWQKIGDESKSCRSIYGLTKGAARELAR